MHYSSVLHILREAKVRVWWILFCLFVTCATCYCFSEDFFFALATPYLKISKTSFFICTQITESLNTYIIISTILGIFFCGPYMIYQTWCFFIPSCNEDQRRTASKIFLFSMVAFFFVLIITFLWIMPNIWLFLYKLSNTHEARLQERCEARSAFFIIKLQPKIYDFSILTLRILFVTGLCSQIPILILCSVQLSLISIQTLVRNRPVSGFISILLAALITPPDLWCQLSAWLCILVLIELAIFIAIVQLQYSSPK
jgi:Tat protein translocase TatC